MNDELENIHEIMDNLPPLTLAKLAALIPSLAYPEMDCEELDALNVLGGGAYDAGIRNCGDDFIRMFLDAGRTI